METSDYLLSSALLVSLKRPSVCKATTQLVYCTYIHSQRATVLYIHLLLPLPPCLLEITTLQSICLLVMLFILGSEAVPAGWAGTSDTLLSQDDLVKLSLCVTFLAQTLFILLWISNLQLVIYHYLIRFFFMRLFGRHSGKVVSQKGSGFDSQVWRLSVWKCQKTF